MFGKSQSGAFANGRHPFAIFPRLGSKKPTTFGGRPADCWQGEVAFHTKDLGQAKEDMTELVQLLWSGSPEERRLLSQILDCSDQDPVALAVRLQKLSTSFFGWHVGKERLSYHEIVRRIAQYLRVDDAHCQAAADLELAITQMLWDSVWET